MSLPWEEQKHTEGKESAYMKSFQNMSKKDKVSVFHAQKSGLSRLKTGMVIMDEALSLITDGVYTVFPICSGGLVLRFKKHLERLKESALASGFAIQNQEHWLRENISQAIAFSGFCNCKVKLIITQIDPSGVYIIIGSHETPGLRIIADGVNVGLTRSNIFHPEIKNTQKIQLRQELLTHFEKYYEVLLYNNNNQILEGTSSNFYCVLNNQLLTAGSSILQGASRGILLEVASEIIPIIINPIHVDKIGQLDEALLTSSSRGVIPITKIRGTEVGTGKPGPITTRLIDAYGRKVLRELEKL